VAELAIIARNEAPARAEPPVARKAAPVEAPAGEAPATDAAPARPKKKRLLGGLAAALLLVGGGVGYQYAAVWTHQESTDNAYVRADITPVAAKVEGYVARLAVSDNQPVKAGDVLMVIESADYQAKVAKAEADLAAALANLGTLQAARRSAGAELGAQAGVIGQASANVAAAQAAAIRAAADERRFSELAAKGWATRARLDEVRAQAQSARAQVAAARAAVAATRGQSGALAAGTEQADAGIAAGRAQVQAARAALDAARLDLSRTVIRAPVDGIVGNRAVREGQLVRPGQQLLAVVPATQSYVVANFKETQLEKMRVGQPVELAVDAYPGLKVRGRIESLAPASGAQFALIPTDSASGNFTKIVQRVPVKIAVEKDGLAARLLRPGLSVEAIVDTRD
jgi:membrane fusion protein (multidrug efflux system)